MAEQPTTGELAVKLDLVLEQLTELSRSVMTKDVFDTWRQGNNDRIQRSEDALREWVKTSTEAHVSLDRDSKARHAETIALVEKEVAMIHVNLDKVNARVDDSNEKTSLKFKERDKQREEDEKTLKSAKNTRVNLWIAAGLSFILSITASVLLRISNVGG